jgi:tetraacyldisaccharide 4'-kinase
MTPPRFWFNPPHKPGFFARLLAPLGMLYAAGTARRLQQGPRVRVGVPVICIGNINAGGTGKTPATIAIATRLMDMGLEPHVVSRGYGGSLKGPVRVDPAIHDATRTGDEPLLLAAFCPTWVSADRVAGAQAAVAAGADVILLDDGFQNPALYQDISIVVVDALKGFGNGRVLPAGPLREPVETGLARAGFLLTIGEEADRRKFAGYWQNRIRIPHLSGCLKPLQTGIDFRELRVLAFAGIGHPEKFFATLKRLGADIVHAKALGDHQPLGTALMRRLDQQAKSLDAHLVTTEKDAVRLPDAYRFEVLTVPVRLELDDWSAFDKALADAGISRR